MDGEPGELRATTQAGTQDETGAPSLSMARERGAGGLSKPQKSGMNGVKMQKGENVLHICILAEGLAKRSPSSMLCNTTSSLIVRGAESAVHCGEAAQRGLAPAPRSAHSGVGERAVGGGGGEARGGGGGGAGGGMTGEAAGLTGEAAATSGAAQEGGVTARRR